MEKWFLFEREELGRTDISLFEKGLYYFLCSIKDTEIISVKYICEQFKEKEIRVKKALNELIKKGFINREPKYINGKLRGQKYIINKQYSDREDISLWK